MSPQAPGGRIGALGLTPHERRAGGRQPANRQGSNPRRFGIIPTCPIVPASGNFGFQVSPLSLPTSRMEQSAFILHHNQRIGTVPSTRQTELLAQDLVEHPRGHQAA